MRCVLASGVGLSVRQIGNGSDVVLVHGLAANMAFWNLLMLRALAANRCLTLFDLRGHGGSELAASGYSIPELSRDLGELMRALGIARAHLVGHSFGGLVALDFAVRSPECVSSLALLDTRIPTLQPAVRLREWSDAEAALAEFRAYGIEMDADEDAVGVKLLELMADAGWREHADPSGLWKPFGRWSGNSRSARRWLELLRSTRAAEEFRHPAAPPEEEIRALPLPLLGVYGETSRCRPTLMRLGQLRPDLRSVVVQGAGHFHPLMKPEATTRALGAFLDGIESPSEQGRWAP